MAVPSAAYGTTSTSTAPPTRVSPARCDTAASPPGRGGTTTSSHGHNAVEGTRAYGAAPSDEDMAPCDARERPPLNRGVKLRRRAGISESARAGARNREITTDGARGM